MSSTGNNTPHPAAQWGAFETSAPPAQTPAWLQEQQQATQASTTQHAPAQAWSGLAPVTGTVSQQPRVLRGDQAVSARRARVSSDLRGAKPTMIDPEILEAARQSAATAGYADGWAEGQRAAQGQVRAEAQAAVEQFEQVKTEYAQALQHALAQVAQAADDLERRMAQPMGQVEAELSAACVELAQILLGHQLRWPSQMLDQLAADPAFADVDLPDPLTVIGLDAVRRALRLAPAKRPVTLRLHPEQAQAIEETLASDPSALVTDRSITIMADATLDLTDCVAECDATRIDAQLAPAVQRVRALLAEDSSGQGGAGQGSAAHDDTGYDSTGHEGADPIGSPNHGQQG